MKCSQGREQHERRLRGTAQPGGFRLRQHTCPWDAGEACCLDSGEPSRRAFTARRQGLRSSKGHCRGPLIPSCEEAGGASKHRRFRVAYSWSRGVFCVPQQEEKAWHG